jgi:hypothetical protein
MSCAPTNQDAGVRRVIEEVRGHVGTFCLFGSGASWPWEMANAWRYFQGRTGTWMRSGWNNFGIHQDWLRDRARDSIRFRATPAVIGTGWLNHYPMAYGLRVPGTDRRRCFVFCWNDTVYDRCVYGTRVGRRRQRVGLREHLVRRRDLPVASPRVAGNSYGGQRRGRTIDRHAQNVDTTRRRSWPSCCDSSGSMRRS